jgi:hypothetical protein
VGLRPEPVLLQPPAVDDVPDEVQLFRFCVLEEIEEELGLQPRVPRWMSEMKIAWNVSVLPIARNQSTIE